MPASDPEHPPSWTGISSPHPVARHRLSNSRHLGSQSSKERCCAATPDLYAHPYFCMLHELFSRSASRRLPSASLLARSHWREQGNPATAPCTAPKPAEECNRWSRSAAASARPGRSTGLWSSNLNKPDKSGASHQRLSSYALSAWRPHSSAAAMAAEVVDPPRERKEPYNAGRRLPIAHTLASDHPRS